MLQVGFHATVPVTDGPGYAGVCASITEAGLEPLISGFRTELANSLEPLGISRKLITDRARLFEFELEVFVTPDRGSAVITRSLLPLSSKIKEWEFEAVVVSPNPTPLADLLRREAPIALADGTRDEAQSVWHIDRVTGSPSPNGRKTSDSEFRHRIHDLFNDDLRRKARATSEHQPEDVRVALRGLWLEAYVAQTLMDEAPGSRVWCGATIGPHEIDITAVVGDSTVVIDCADDSIGQNDVMNTVAKSEMLSSRAVVRLITTHDAHPNVMATCEQVRRAKSGLDLDVISTESCASIAAEIHALVQAAYRSRLDWWFRDWKG